MQYSNYVKGNIKSRVVELRKKGLMFGEILKVIGANIPKSTMSVWCNNVNLPKQYRERIKKINLLHLEKIRKIALRVNKEKRAGYLSELAKRSEGFINKAGRLPKKILLSILYLGEGAKHSGSQALTLSSSSPDIIKFYLKLLKNCYNIDEKRFRARIQCRFDQNKGLLEKFWQRQTNIGKQLFYPTYVDKRTEGKPTLKKDYKGVCTIHYFNTEIQLELEILAKKVIDKIVSGR